MKMKKLFLLLSAVTLLSAAGCTQRYYDYQQGVTLSQRDFTIGSGDWYKETQEDGAAFLSAKLNVPEITKDIVNYGTVMVSRKIYDGGNIYWAPLPVSRAERIDYGTDQQQLYSTYLDFEWGLGTVYVYYTATDFLLDEGGAPEIELRVTVMR